MAGDSNQGIKAEPSYQDETLGSAVGAVRISGLAKYFNRTVAVDHISAEIPAGSYCCILGPSGCGKTTTLRMIAGHEQVDAGTVVIDDCDSTHLAPAQRPTSMMFQSYALFPHLSVEDNVSFGMRLQGAGREERFAEALRLLEIVEMSDFAKRLPQQLSGGQQQRIALARALATKPAVLALDEPLSALDPFLRVRVRGELKRLQRQLGITFLHVTHSQEEALALADLIMVMNAGKIEQFGSPDQIFHRPSNLFVSRFMGAHNELIGEVQSAKNNSIKLATGNEITKKGIKEFSGKEVAVLVPIKDCYFMSGDDKPVSSKSGLSQVQVEVESVEYAGTDLTIRCQLTGMPGEPFVIPMPLSEIGPTPPEIGMRGTMNWPSDSSILRAVDGPVTPPNLNEE